MFDVSALCLQTVKDSQQAVVEQMADTEANLLELLVEGWGQAANENLPVQRFNCWISTSALLQDPLVLRR